MPNLVSLTRPNHQILGKNQTEIFQISGFLVNPSETKIAITPQTVMILTWNLDQVKKKLAMTPCQQIVTLLYFFQFLANLQPSRSRIPEAWYIELTFSLTVTFYLQHSSYTIALNKVAIFAKKCWFFARKMLTSAILSGSWYWKVYFIKLHMCVYFHTKFRDFSIVLTIFR